MRERAAVRERAGGAGRTLYVESSALLAAVLEADLQAGKALQADGVRLVTSALTRAQAHRAVVRARHFGRLGVDQEAGRIRRFDIFFRQCEVVAISDDILNRANRPYTVQRVRTLAASHRPI